MYRKEQKKKNDRRTNEELMKYKREMYRKL